MIQRFRSRTSKPHVADHSKRPSKGFASGALLGSIMATSGAFYAGGQVSATATGEFIVMDVAAGEDHVCALVEFPNDDRALYCWGVNDYRQLGIGNPSDDPAIVGDEIPGYVYSGGRPYATLPVEVLPSGDFTNTNVELISSGVRHTCAVESGTMFCWGSGNSGRLGNGDTDDRNLPTEVSAQNGFLNQNVTAISVGDRHTCAIESGVVYCWGSASDGRVGQPEESSYLTPQVVSPGVDFINSGVQSVAAGSSHTCALKTGVVHCWGSGSSGQIGSGAWDSSSPHLPRTVSVAGAFLNASVTDIGVWGTVSCAIEGGAMFCWGSGIELGEPKVIDPNPEVSPDFPTFNTAKPVSSGPDGFSNTNIDSFSKAKDGNSDGSHACAIKSGAIYCWGTNRSGQLGNGNVLPTVDDEDPTQLSPVKVVDFMPPVSTSEVGVASNSPTFSNTSVTIVSAGQRFTCAVQGGNLYCWGVNDYGQLGTSDNDSVERSIPWLVFNPSAAEGPNRPIGPIDLDHYLDRLSDETTALPDTR